MTNQPTFWWVNQGTTFAEERKDGFIWAPQKNKANKSLFHWDNVSRVRQGDVIFHYAKGNIVAVSLATSDGYEQDKPSSLTSEPWEKAGWMTNCEYFDLPEPLALDEVAHPLRKLKLKNGPINSKGTVNQGYLYGLNRVAALVISVRLEIAELPERLVAVLAPLVDRRWELFVQWAHRIFASGNVRENERGYKIELQPVLEKVHQAISAADSGWPQDLKKAFGHKNNNFTHHINHSKFLEWCMENTANEKAAQALLDLWDPNTELSQAADSFLDAWPKEDVSGAGVRSNITSFLTIRRDPSDCPVYVSTPYETAYQLTGFPISQPVDDKSTYQDALKFLDRFIEEARKRGLVLEDRLDAQSAMYAVTKYDMSMECFAEWSEEDKAVFTHYQTGKGGTVVPPTGLDALADELLLDVKQLKKIEGLIKSKRQVIFYGPPGTGKTFVALQLAEYLAGDKDRTQLVQFHPSYSYEDFVEGYRPYLTPDEQPAFQLEDGPLRRIAARAQEDPDNEYVLVIDEINRGNIAKIFGELFFLLEYRDHPVNLQYSSDQDFVLPKNLLFIGTMNTADQSIALLDAALRRRFYFAPFFPNRPPIEGLLARWLKKHKPALLWLADVVDRANTELGDWNAAIGPSYFLKEDLDEDDINLIWEHSILPFIEDRFFGDTDRIKAFELQRLRQTTTDPTTEVETADEAASAD